MELWKEIFKYDGKISISTSGRVRNNITGRILKQSTGHNGYLQVVVKDFNHKKHTIRVHRELAVLFIPNLHSKCDVNHIDGNKLNNNINNLEWATREENIQHAFRYGLILPKQGTECHFSRLSNEQVKYILDHPEIRNIDLAKLYNIDRSAISKIRSGKNWKQNAGVAE